MSSNQYILPSSRQKDHNLHRQMLDFMRPDTMATSAPLQLQQNMQAKYRTEARAMEQKSLHEVYQLVVMCCECASLWRLLCEAQVSQVIGRLSAVSVLCDLILYL